MTDASVCIPNIGPRERRKRQVIGVTMTLVTVVVAVWFLTTDVPRWWRVVVALPALLAGLGFFQARAQTCVALAAKGTMNLDDGDRAVGDADLLSAMRRQSNRVILQAVVAAALVTLVLLVI